ncbi:hypothetical protein L6452_25603 [Arctium lappa]|uniref:Uncharacterized protein n=1 Tax=Arctium lappa TaxID=4217 RepID=A0ACB9ABE3_ARCLA|nr:hypothetical protein L6452_25603 [Arctium lappa]
MSFPSAYRIFEYFVTVSVLLLLQPHPHMAKAGRPCPAGSLHQNKKAQNGVSRSNGEEVEGLEWWRPKENEREGRNDGGGEKPGKSFEIEVWFLQFKVRAQAASENLYTKGWICVSATTMAAIGGILRSKLRLSVSSLLHHDVMRIPILKGCISYSSSSIAPLKFNHTTQTIDGVCHCEQQLQRYLRPRYYHDGRPRGSLWRGKKLLGKEALFVILGLKRVKDDEEKLDKFVKTHVSRLLKMDMVAVLNELERQEEVHLAVKMFWVIQKQDWYQPDVYLYKDLIISLAKSKKMDEAMKLWESMKKENLYPDSQTYTEVIRGFLRFGSPADAMNIYEDMKQSPDPPDELPFRILLKGLLPHPLLRNKVKQDFEEIFPEQSIYDPPEEIFGLR